MSSPSVTPIRGLDDLPVLLTKSQLAELLGVTTRTIDRWTAKGLVQARILPGGRRRYPRADVASLLSREADGERERCT